MRRFICSIFAACLSASSFAKAPKNIIMVVGDGMGPAYTSAYRYFADDPSTAVVERTVFDRLQVGMSSTYPAKESGYITDSAASATALSSGVKSYNGAIAVDVNKQPTLTLMEQAKRNGMKTGLAVTSQIVHATPASYAAHNESRKNYNQIADSYFDDRIDGAIVADVMLGGGWQYFLREDRNLVSEFTQAGYQYIDQLSQLNQTTSAKPLLGLFADVGLPWQLDMQQQPRLLAMVKTALRHLQNDQGYFLLIEASQIDWAGHANDIAAAMAEMQDLAVTLNWLESYLDEHTDTLMVVTADHSTGGLTIAADGVYEWHPKWIQSLKASPAQLVWQLPQDDSAVDWLSEQLGFALTAQEHKQVKAMQSMAEKQRYSALKSLIDARTNTGWTTGGHTGIDVPILAKGVGSERFYGHLDNTEIAKRLFSLMAEKQLAEKQ